MPKNLGKTPPMGWNLWNTAIGTFNFGDRRARGTFAFRDRGLPEASDFGFEMYDCWEHKIEGRFAGSYTGDVEAHGCKVLRARLVKM